jgi:hypothetical protein
MGPISGCSYVTIRPKHLSPTPGLSHGWRNEATKTTAGPVCLWLLILLPGVGACFDFMGASEKLSHTGTARRKRTPGVCGLEWEAYVACWSGFSLQGVYRFESPPLSDMSNRLFVTVIT